MARNNQPPDLYLQVIGELKDSISAQIADLKEYVREDSRRVHDQQQRYDASVKMEFAAVKSMVADISRLVNSMATKEEVAVLGARISSLETDRTKAQGAWWMAIKIVGVLVGFAAAAAWLWERVERFAFRL